MATPYNPAANPYIMNTKELPANQVAAAQVPAWSVSTTLWAQSPNYLPNWGDESRAAGSVAAQAISPVATATVTWPDAAINARDLAANTSLNTEKARQTSIQTAAANAITAINNITTTSITVVTVSPATCVHAVATAVVIQGSGFTGATAVNIGGACTAVTVVDDGEITCTTPAASVAGTANVVVTAPAGTGTLTGGFIYT